MLKNTPNKLTKHKDLSPCYKQVGIGRAEWPAPCPGGDGQEQEEDQGEVLHLEEVSELLVK